MKPHTNLFLAIVFLAMVLSDALDLFHLRHLESRTEAQDILRYWILIFDPLFCWIAAFNITSAIRKLLKP